MNALFAHAGHFGDHGVLIITVGIVYIGLMNILTGQRRIFGNRMEETLRILRKAFKK
jgi:hypothetical protein